MNSMPTIRSTLQFVDEVGNEEDVFVVFEGRDRFSVMAVNDRFRGTEVDGRLFAELSRAHAACVRLIEQAEADLVTKDLDNPRLVREVGCRNSLGEVGLAFEIFAGEDVFDNGVLYVVRGVGRFGDAALHGMCGHDLDALVLMCEREVESRRQ